MSIDKKPSGTVRIETVIDTKPVQKLKLDLEEAAIMAERLADAFERIKAVFEN